MKVLHEPGRGRRGAVAGVAFVAVMASAAPAFGHASIPSAAAFGFQPNPSGGTGAPGTTSPYPANANVVIWVRAPDENEEPLGNGDPDVTVDVKIIVPAGWTNPTCGQAATNKADSSTVSTNQPGTPVAGWSCQVEDAGGHKVLHFHGPAVAAPGTDADGAQFFSFNVTTPTPAVQTTYNGVAGSGTEGYIVDQSYSGGEVAHWIPSADYPGTLPAGALQGVVATGLVRTVAAEGVTPPPPPQSAGAQQTITATVGAVGEEFTMTIPSNPGINMASAAPGSYFGFTGALNAITLKDTRSSKPAWTVSGQISNFSPNNVNGKYLGWTPKVTGAGAGAVPGTKVEAGITTGNGLRTSSVLASAPAGHAIGAATLGADLDLRLPLDTPPGSYSATLTITAI